MNSPISNVLKFVVQQLGDISQMFTAERPNFLRCLLCDQLNSDTSVEPQRACVVTRAPYARKY